MRAMLFIAFFILLLVSIFIINVDALQQTATEVIIDIKPGETKTFEWGLKSDEENEVTTVELSADRKGSEFLSFEKILEIEPQQLVYTTITVSIPDDYPGGIELKPKLHATQLAAADIGGISFNIKMGKVVNLNIGLNDNPDLWVDWQTIEASQEEQMMTEIEQTPTKDQSSLETTGGGCLIATATFGSELAPQVQMLRELRDNTILGTQSGTTFMTGFNQLYYSFSPTVADWERQNPAFKELVKLTITPMLATLSILNYVDIDSEAQMLGWGLSIIALNLIMYVAAPATAVCKVCKHLKGSK